MANRKPTDFAEFQGIYNAEKQKQKRPTILVAGYTGSGKTSIIRALCGGSVVPDDAIGAGLPKTQFFDFYQGNAIRFFDSKGLEPGHSEQAFLKDVQSFVLKVQKDPNVDNHIHLVWYALQGCGARVTPCDLRLMKEMLPQNQLALITKNDITRPEQREAMTQVLLDNMINKDRIVPCSEHDKESLKLLEELSCQMLPEAYRAAFTASQMVNLERKKKNAQAIIHTAAMLAAGVAVIPIPVADAALITPIQLSMVASLAINYGEPTEGLKAAIMPVIAEAIGIQAVAGLMKLIPGFGIVISTMVAAALTEAVGQLVSYYLAARFLARFEGRPVPGFEFDLAAFLNFYKFAKKA